MGRKTWQDGRYPPIVWTITMPERTLLYEEYAPIWTILVSKFWLLIMLMFLWAVLQNVLIERGVSVTIAFNLGPLMLLVFLLVVWLRVRKPNQILINDTCVVLKNGKKEYLIPFSEIIGITPAVLLAVDRQYRIIPVRFRARRATPQGEALGEPFRINVVSFEFSGWRWIGIVINTRSTTPYFFHCTEPGILSEKMLKIVKIPGNNK